MQYDFSQSQHHQELKYAPLESECPDITLKDIAILTISGIVFATLLAGLTILIWT